MKNIGSSALIAGLLVANVAVADPVAVKDGAVFVAGNDLLSVLPADDSIGLPDSCDLATTPLSITSATDVVISDGKAFVTSNNAGEITVTTVDVSSCLVTSSSCDSEPTVDLASGVLIIPCLEANGQIYDIEMHQRGNSMNWEVTGVEDSIHHHEDHHDD